MQALELARAGVRLTQNAHVIETQPPQDRVVQAVLAVAAPETPASAAAPGDVQRSGVCAVDDNVSGSIMPTRAIRRECGDRRLFFGFMVRDALRKLVLSGIITPLFSIAQTAGSSMAMSFILLKIADVPSVPFLRALYAA